MKHCDRMPPRWNRRGDWQSHWHALFCAECRGAWGADRKLRRGAGAFRRTLDQAPLPSELEAQIQARLGLVPTGDRRQRRGAPPTMGLTATPVAHGLGYATGVAALLGVFGVMFVHWIHSNVRVPDSQVASRSRPVSLPPEQLTRTSAGTRGEGNGLTAFTAASTPGPSPDFRGGGMKQGSRLSPPSPRIGGGGQGVGAGASPPLSPLSRFRGKEAGAGWRHDDLAALNGAAPRQDRHGAPLPHDPWERIEARLRATVRVRDDFVTIPFPRLASTSDRQIAAAADSYKREAAIVDPRLSREATCAFKATALSDLCDRLHSETGIQLTAGSSVADEKVTVFCEKLPLREVMRQLSRPFGYTWLRSRSVLGVGSSVFGSASAPNTEHRTPNTEYRYELVQDLRSQLLEEELRNRDRDEGLLALDREIERYRPYLSLSPDEALAQSKSAAPADKPLLEHLAGLGWGPVQMYFRLSPDQQAAVRAGQRLLFAQEPGPGELPLPPDMARGVLQCNRGWHIISSEKGMALTPDLTDPRGVLLTALPDVRAKVAVVMYQSELGVFSLGGQSGAFAARSSDAATPRRPGGFGTMDGGGPLAAGTSPAILQPDNAAANARLAHDPALGGRVSVVPQEKGESPDLASDHGSASPRLPSPSRGGAGGGAGGGVGSAPKLTSADVLEALHRATHMPIVADFYTRLYAPETVSVKDRPLFDTLNQLADTMRLRWNKEGGWLQYRSTSFYNDRLKEVPNRLLARWSASRQKHGALTLDDLVEIAGLTDAQLNGADMAEGAREGWGLAEWELVRTWPVRIPLRYLAEFTPAQRQEMMSATGLALTKMSLPQQQQFIATALHGDERPLQSLDELAGATLRVDYTVPGSFEWRTPGPAWLQWVVPLDPSPQGRRVLMPPMRGQTRESALAAARQLDPPLREAAAQALRASDPRSQAGPRVDESEIVPTRLNVTIVYIPGLATQRALHILRPQQDLTSGPGG